MSQTTNISNLVINKLTKAQYDALETPNPNELYFVVDDLGVEAGSGLSLDGNTINHSNSVTAGTAGTSSATSGATLAVPYVNYDAQGHITGSGTHTHTINGLATSAISSGTFADERIASADTWNAKQDAITFDGTYNASTNKAATVSTVTSAINALDGGTIGTPGTGKTITALSEENGNISATFGDISITKSQVSDFPSTITPSSHTHGNITNDGDITSTVTIASGDRLVINDESESELNNSSITFGTSETQYLTNKGTWKTPDYPVTSVNGSTGAVTLSASDVGALPSDTTIPEGTVTSVRVQATSPVQSSTSTAQSSSLDTTISLANGYGDTKNPYGSKTANTVLAAPDGSNGTPSFRALVADDIPSITKSKISDFPTEMTPSSHTHGDITNSGDITTTATIASGDRLVINDESASKVTNSSIIFGTDTASFLSNAGTWETPVGGVSSVNSKTGDVTLTASDVGALPNTTSIPSATSDLTNDSGFITSSDIPVTSVNSKTGDIILSASDVGAQSTITASGILKGNGSGEISAAVAGTDYQAAGDYMVRGVDYVTAGQRSGTTLGNGATAEGGDNTASGDYSHTEGISTIASAAYAHTEGMYTTASALYGSHAEGHHTTASGQYGSHAEGRYTTASGLSSHSEGTYTEASKPNQHVFGKYNIIETGSHVITGTYVEIVGNGTADDARSNARTLDWSGNETLAGKLTVGTAPSNDMDVATKKYVDDSIPAVSYPVTSVNSQTGDVSLTSSDVNAIPSNMSGANLAASVSVATKTSSGTFYWANATDTPTKYNIAKYDDGAYLKSTTPAASDSSTKVATTAYVTNAISTLGSVLNYKGTKATTSELPSTGNNTGDVWIVTADNSEFVWNGSAWEKFGPTIDLSGYVPTTRTVNGKALSSDITLTASDVNALPSSTNIPDSTSDLTNDSGFITSSDIPVTSVNTKTGAVSLTASDVGALPDSTTYVSSFNGSTGAVTYSAPVTSVNTKTGDVSLTASDVGALPDSTSIPTATSDLTNDSGFITASDIPQQIFIAEYGTETFANIRAAHVAGKIVFTINDSKVFRLVYCTASSVVFVRNTGSPSVEVVTVSTADEWAAEYQNAQGQITASGILKGDGAGGVTAAVAGTDYQAPISNNITGSGTNNYIAKFNGANTITSGPAFGSSTTTYLTNAGTWATPAGTNGHAHGNITSAGDITTTATIASGDRLVINDESASKVTNSSITFGTTTTTFLSNAGTWLTPAKGNTATTKTASLAVASWNTSTKTISVTVSGVTASNLVEVSPAPASWSVASAAGVYCSAQAANSLTFTCSSIPTAAITVNVVIWG